MTRKIARYSPRLKFQVVLEALNNEKTAGQIAKAYNVHPISIGLWRKRFLERGPEIFAREAMLIEYERRAELEQLVGKKEVEIAFLKNFLHQSK